MVELYGHLAVKSVKCWNVVPCRIKALAILFYNEIILRWNLKSYLALCVQHFQTMETYYLIALVCAVDLIPGTPPLLWLRS